MGVRDLAPRRVGLAATTGAAAVVVAGAGAQWLGRSAGSTRQERGRPLRGDGIVDRPTVVTDHAVSIAVAAAVVWPWLTQVGWHLGGWYTPRWVDRLLFPANTPSADRLDPALVRDLRVGDTIPDGPPGTAYFTVAEVAPPHLLVLHSTTHLPPGWGERLGAAIDWTWTFALEPEGEGCRVHLRVRGRTAPWWLTAGYVAFVVPADYVMALGMLKGLRVRAERPG